MKKMRTTCLLFLAAFVISVCAGCSNADFSPENATPAATESQKSNKAASTDTMSGAVRPSSDPAFMTGEADSEDTMSEENLISETGNLAAGEITGGVNLRDAPGGNTVTTISEGTEVKVLGKHGNWYHIYNEGEEGYVYKNYISVDESADIPDETEALDATEETED